MKADSSTKRVLFLLPPKNHKGEHYLVETGCMRTIGRAVLHPTMLMTATSGGGGHRLTLDLTLITRAEAERWRRSLLGGEGRRLTLDLTPIIRTKAKR